MALTKLLTAAKQIDFSHHDFSEFLCFLKFRFDFDEIEKAISNLLEQ